MGRFEFATASQIIFGRGEVKRVGSLAAGFGNSALVVIGKETTRAMKILNILHGNQIITDIYQIYGEPTVSMIQQGVNFARVNKFDVVVGFGGGSVLDAGKAIAGLVTNRGDIYEYLEVIGEGRQLVYPSLPYIAIPTTSGTGAEVTRNSVLGVPERGIKVSMRSQYLLPSIALVDPELTYSMPRDVTVRTGMDALTQLIEPFVSKHSNPMTDALCREGIGLAARSLRTAAENGRDTSARSDMSLASLFGGLSLANAKLGAVHGFAGVLGGKYEIHHGTICARLLPEVMKVNLRVIINNEPESEALKKYNDIGQILTSNLNATATDGVKWVDDLCSDLDIPGLSEFGVLPGHFPEIINSARRSSSMKGNPVELSPEGMHEILLNSLARPLTSPHSVVQ